MDKKSRERILKEIADERFLSSVQRNFLNTAKKSVTTYEQGDANYAKYLEGIKKLQKENPDRFAALQEKNTDRKIEMLNMIDFGMDEYTYDPVSAKGQEDLAQVARIPFGTENTNLGGPTYGMTLADTNQPNRNKDRVFFSGGMFSKNREKTDLTPEELIRHEGQHRVPGFNSEASSYTLDGLYRRYHDVPLGNNKYRKRDFSPSTMRFNKQFGVNNPEVANNVLPETASTKGIEDISPGDIRKMKGKDPITLLSNANKFNLTMYDGLSRDLPNVGWFDESVNKVRGAFGY